MGALPTLYAAAYPGLDGGTYVGPDRFFEARGHPKRGAGASAAARDEEVARRLWEVSEDLTAVSFQISAGAEAA